MPTEAADFGLTESAVLMASNCSGFEIRLLAGSNTPPHARRHVAAPLEKPLEKQ